MLYRSGETPKVGDRVMFDPENPLHLFRRPQGSLGTVYELGVNLYYASPNVVMVMWDKELPWPDEECYIPLLSKVN